MEAYRIGCVVSMTNTFLSGSTGGVTGMMQGYVEEADYCTRRRQKMLTPWAAPGLLLNWHAGK
jgi:hypothetical protein